jgi:lysophospholipase L1-like esterase
MKRFKQLSKLLLVAALVFTGCEGQEQDLIDDRLADNPLPGEPSTNYDNGEADFSNYVAIGNSLTAGYMDAALYNAGQANSVAAMMNAQFEAVGGTDDFKQPNINSANGFNTAVSNPNAQLGVLGRFKLDTSIPGPSPVVGGDPITPYSGTTSELNNFGVPGIQVGQLLTPAAGGPNSEMNPAFSPFYQRFASNPSADGSSGSTILGDAISAGPTFFSLWIGNNDVLGFAVSGATNDAIFTSTADYQTRFSAVITNLMQVPNLKGVVIDIPPILAIPYFRAVTFDNVTLDAETAGALNQAFAGFNGALDAIVQNLGHDAQDAAMRKVNYEAGANPILIVDDNLEDLGPKFDQLEEAGAISAQQRAALAPYEQARPMMGDIPQLGDELVLLTAGSILGTLADPNNPQSQIGVVVPLGDQYTLTSDEIVEIETARQTFNGIMQQVVQGANASSTRIAFHSTNAANGTFADLFGLSDGQLGVRVGGTNLAPDFSPNGVFSTDGIHPNQRGNALLVNDVLETVESTFGATLPEVSVLNLPSVQVCAGDCVSQIGS